MLSPPTKGRAAVEMAVAVTPVVVTTASVTPVAVVAVVMIPASVLRATVETPARLLVVVMPASVLRATVVVIMLEMMAPHLRRKRK